MTDILELSLGDLADTIAISPVVPSDEQWTSRRFSRVLVWQRDGALPASDELVVVPPVPAEDLTPLAEQVLAQPVSAWLFCGWDVQAVDALVAGFGASPLLLGGSGVTVTDILTTTSSLDRQLGQNELRHLTSLQRSLSQALGQAGSIDDLLRRLHRHTNAACAIVTSHGRVDQNTGTLPMSLLLGQMMQTGAPAQRLSVDDWNGFAIRLKDADRPEQEAGGWLVTAARRESFPDTGQVAALHIAATLVETARDINEVNRRQKLAIRSAIFDEALALEPVREFPETTSRIMALGIDLNEPVHVLVAVRAYSGDESPVLELKRLFEESDLPYLYTARERRGIFLVQADLESIRRVLRHHAEAASRFVIGIGRRVRDAGDIARSHEDALVAVRTIIVRRRKDRLMAFDEFDVATELFASVTFEAMAEISRSFLAPIMDKKPLLDALRKYFELSQNINASASALGIHHNTLRYRLSKVEERLKVSLSSPSAVSSLFLATMCLDLLDAKAEAVSSPPEAAEFSVPVIRSGDGAVSGQAPQVGVRVGGGRPADHRP